MLRLTVTLRMVRYKNVLLKSNFIQANFKKEKEPNCDSVGENSNNFISRDLFFFRIKKKDHFFLRIHICFVMIRCLDRQDGGDPVRDGQ